MHIYVLRIVPMDKILCFKNSFIIIIFNSLIGFWSQYMSEYIYTWHHHTFLVLLSGKNNKLYCEICIHEIHSVELKLLCLW